MTDPAHPSTGRIGDGRRARSVSVPAVVDSITVRLSLHDVAIIAVALADVRAPAGGAAWSHPRVERLRMKLADAITERIGA